jgi:hypothetical protein
MMPRYLSAADNNDNQLGEDEMSRDDADQSGEDESNSNIHRRPKWSLWVSGKNDHEASEREGGEALIDTVRDLIRELEVMLSKKQDVPEGLSFKPFG